MNSRVAILFVLQIIWTTGLSQTPPLPEDFGDSFQNTNLEVHWNVSSNALPDTVFVYRLLPRQWPLEAVSNLLSLGSFTAKNITKSNAEEVVYKSDGRHPTDQLSISGGGIEYFHSITHSKYGPTNLAVEVPEIGRLAGLATNFLSGLGISLSDIETNSDGTPKFQFIEPQTLYHSSDSIITNVEFRVVSFNRNVDGFRFLSVGTGGDGELDFGELGKVVKVDLSWRNLERYKSCSVAKPEMIIEWIRGGKARQGGISMNLPPIDWATVKSLTVRKAELCYFAGGRLSPSDILLPLASLWTTVDTGNGVVDVEIDCPVSLPESVH